MTWLARNIIERWWIQELLIFATLFILFTLNDWTVITSWGNLWMGICYFCILYTHAQIHRFALLPVLLDRHNPVTYIVLTTLLVLVFGLILSVAKKYWLYPDCYLNTPDTPQTYLFHTATAAVSLIAILAPFVLLRFYRQQKKQSTAQLCVNKMELDTLRAQLNPHFLFNTFNNLYGISLQEPARIPDLIMQVSQLMRYQLENSNKQWVSLEEELAFLENYIALEEERVGQRCKIQYDYTIDKPGQGLQIAPMILIALVENAFKHGANSIDMCYVKIEIAVQNKKLEMCVVNSIPGKHEKPTISTGIGLPNMEQRLNILYPGTYHLKSKIENNEYQVCISLPLHK